MLNATNKSIEQLIFVVGYKQDSEIRIKQFDIEKALKPLIDAQSVNTNVSDNHDPRIPRITFTKERMSVFFSQIAAQLTINIDNSNDKPLNVIKDSVSKKIQLFRSCIDGIIPSENLLEQGLVLKINYLVDKEYSIEEINSYIHSRFFRLVGLGDIQSAQFSAGYKTNDDLFITLSVMQYSINEREIPFGASEWLNINTFSIIESGIELKIDVNSRPLIGITDKSKVTDLILEKSFNFVMTEADDFIGVDK